MRLLLPLALATLAAGIDIKVLKNGGTKASPLEYGLMFEDINHSGDGGIYAELIQNRAFQGDEYTPSTLHPWKAFGPASISLLNSSTPLSEALPTSVEVKTNSTAGEEIGISNPGWWGIEVKKQIYTGSFWVLGAYEGHFLAALRSNSTGEIFVSTRITSKSKETEWTKHEFTLEADVDAGFHVDFTLTYLANENGKPLTFNLVSLFPPTWKGRENGLRIDLMQALKDLNPSFLRIPGGNNLQGRGPGSQWRWNETIGDLIHRPGRTGPWNYYNTDGLGLIEYLLWCQDLEMEPLLIVFAGLHLDGTIIPEEDLDFYIQDALHEIEFVTGDASTEYGAKRAALGYEEPFPLHYVGVGNEDHFSAGMDSYNAYRFKMFYDAISSTYPDLEILSSTVEIDDIPGNYTLDYHDYGNPDGAVRNFTLWDDYPKKNKIIVGEYGVARDNGNEQLWSNHRAWPWWIASVAEAVFFLGVERNPEKVHGSAFAPLLQNINGFQWSPNMVTFNADTSATVKSTSYHVMKLLSTHRFTEVLSVESSEEYGPGYWVAGVNEERSAYTWKGAVYNTTEPVEFNVKFPRAKAKAGKAKLTVLTAPDAFSENRFGEADHVEYEETVLEAGAKGFHFSLPQWSVAVLDWEYKKRS